MKKCAICAHDNKPSAYSCTACGEASWVPAPAAGDPPADEPTLRRAPIRPDPYEGARGRAGRRGARDQS